MIHYICSLTIQSTRPSPTYILCMPIKAICLHKYLEHKCLRRKEKIWASIYICDRVGTFNKFCSVYLTTHVVLLACCNFAGAIPAPCWMKRNNFFRGKMKWRNRPLLPASALSCPQPSQEHQSAQSAANFKFQVQNPFDSHRFSSFASSRWIRTNVPFFTFWAFATSQEWGAAEMRK
jgi:hypothetical protein